MEQNIYKKRKYISFPKITICYIFIFLASIFWCISYYLIATINPIKINQVDNINQDDIMNRISFELHSIAISQIFFIILYYVNLYLSNSESKKNRLLENEEIISTDNTKVPNLLIQNKESHFPLINYKTTLFIFILSFFHIIYIYILIVMRIKDYGIIDKIFLVGIFNFIIGTLIEKIYYKKILGLHRIIPFAYFSTMIPVYIFTIENKEENKNKYLYFGKYKINKFVEYIFMIIGIFLMVIKNNFYNHFMVIKCINPFFITFLNGFFSLILTIIIFYFLGYNFDFSLLKGKIIIYIFYIIVLFLYFLFLTLSNYYISPTSCGLIFLFNNLFISLIEKSDISLFGIKTLESIWIIPLFLPTIFMSILYCEFIVFHFWSLDHQTKLVIEERGKIEDKNTNQSNSSINYSFDDILHEN